MEYGYLMHYGVKGMKWGIRNYQNADGTLTEAGKKRYAIEHPSRMDSNNKAQMRGAARRYRDTEKWAKKQNALNVKTYKGKQTKAERKDSINALMYSKYKTDAGKTNLGTYDMVRDIAAHQYYKSVGKQVCKNVLGVIGTMGIGIGLIQVRNSQASNFKNLYKEATNKVISDYKNTVVRDLYDPKKVSNKITDMTLNGASQSEIERSIKK